MGPDGGEENVLVVGRQFDGGVEPAPVSDEQTSPSSPILSFPGAVGERQGSR